MRIILIAGDLASGKTTYSRMLSKKYRIVCFNKDTIKETLADQIGFSNREENLKLSVATFHLMCHFIRQFHEADQDIILESNFRDKELKVIHDLCDELGTSFILLNMTASRISVVHERYLAREKSGKRHSAHLSVDLSNYSNFEKTILGNRVTTYLEHAIHIDSTTFDYQADETVFKKIEQYLSSK